MTSILDRPAQFQWDADSAPWKSDNCRCTCEAQIAGYYLNRHIAPADMRRAMLGGSGRSGGTNADDGVRGLAVYGIKATWGWKSPQAVKTLLNAGYPVDIAVIYGRIPQNEKYRHDMGFSGWHSVLAVATGNENGEGGIYVRDPDHWEAKPDKTFWPDRVWIPAFANDSGRRNGIALWPVSKKQPNSQLKYEHIVEVIADVNVRSEPDANSAIVSNRSVGARIKTSMIETQGGAYTLNGLTRTDWLGYDYNGKTIWVARAYTNLVS